MDMTRTGGRILVDALLAQGCDRIFLVPGESYLAVLDALHDTPEIDLIVGRQEGGIAFMAEADGALTHRPGIAFVTRGPGATNASIGVHVAMQDSTPMILFIGDVSRGDRDREAFQEIDFPAMFRPIAKWAARIDDAARIPEYVARAYSVAMSGRPGPVVLALPEDMLTDQVEATDRPRVERLRQAVSSGVVSSAIDLIVEAKSPVAIVGGAGWSDDASRSFTKFAEAWGIPVATAFRRQDALPNSSSVYAGNLGYGPNPRLVARLKAADLLLIVGPRLGEATTDGYTLITPDHPGQTLIHVHPDPTELNRVYIADLPICCGVNTFARALESTLYRAAEGNFPSSKTFQRFPQGAEAHAEWREWSTPQPLDLKLDLGSCVAAMREALPADTIICNGAGNFSGWWHRYWHYAGRVSQLAPTAGAMGYGLPAAIAAARREPTRQVVALAGDGCFLMNGQELATAVRYGLKMLILVIDNGSYSTIRMHQELRYPGRVSGTDLVNPDFAALARAYGAAGETVEATADFAPALTHALAAPGPALLHLKTDVEQIGPSVTIDALRSLAR
jgi:acetolactate synthase-1/2/3 large subunit